MRKLALKKARAKKKPAAPPKKKYMKVETKKTSGLVFKDDSVKPDIPEIPVYVARYYKWKVYSLEDAIYSHRETHELSMFAAPNALVSAYVDLDLKTRKKTKFIEKINRIVVPPHSFDQGIARSILFLSDSDENQKIALKAGATLVAGKDLVRQIRNGLYSLEEHDYVLAHPDILPQLLLAKGVFKSKLPTATAGTLSSKIEEVVSTHKHGIHYQMQKGDLPEYGMILAPFGQLNMDIRLLEENLRALLNDIMLARRSTNFILRTRIECPPSPERFVINSKRYISDLPTKTEKKEVESDDENEEEETEDKTGVIGAV